MRSKAPHTPVWYHPLSPLGSAVRYIASLSPRYDWVGIYKLRSKKLVLGPYLGSSTPRRPSFANGSELVMPIQNKQGRIVGQIDVLSQQPVSFDIEEEDRIRSIVKELGELWPE